MNSGDFSSSGRPKSYTITVSSPSSEGSGYPSIDLTSPSLDTVVLESPVKNAMAAATEDEAKKEGKGKDGVFCRFMYLVEVIGQWCMNNISEIDGVFLYSEQSISKQIKPNKQG